MRPLAVDICCCQGAVSVGLYFAGFKVAGYDTKSWESYPFKQTEPKSALELTGDEKAHITKTASFVWVSPPCQAYCPLTTMTGSGKNHEALIDNFRDLAEELGLPCIIENVAGAKQHLQAPITLRGREFDLRVLRGRWFEPVNGLCIQNGRTGEAEGHAIASIGIHTLTNSNVPKEDVQSVTDIWADGVYEWFTVCGTPAGQPGFNRGTLIQWQQAMAGRKLKSLFWLSGYGCAQAVPVAYAEYLGRQALRHLGYIIEYPPVSYEPMAGQAPGDA